MRSRHGEVSGWGIEWGSCVCQRAFFCLIEFNSALSVFSDDLVFFLAFWVWGSILAIFAHAYALLVIAAVCCWRGRGEEEWVNH